MAQVSSESCAIWNSVSFSTAQKIRDNEILDQLFHDLDQNGDLKIDFKEFITLIAMVTSACEEFSIPQPH